MLTLLAQTIDLYGEASSQGLSGTGAIDATNPEVGFGAYVSGIFSVIMIVAALLVLLYLIWGAIEWITAGGDSGKLGKARDKIIQSIIGIIVLAATFAIFMVVQSLLGIEVISLPASNSRVGNSRSNSNMIPTPQCGTLNQAPCTERDGTRTCIEGDINSTGTRCE